MVFRAISSSIYRDLCNFRKLWLKTPERAWQEVQLWQNKHHVLKGNFSSSTVALDLAYVQLGLLHHKQRTQLKVSMLTPTQYFVITMR